MSNKLLLYSVISFIVIGTILFGTTYFSQITNKQVSPGSCKILEEKYCNKGKFVPGTKGGYWLVFNVPSGTPLFAPLSGMVNDTVSTQFSPEGPVYKGIAFTSLDEKTQLSSSLIIVFNKKNDLVLPFDVRKGDLIGSASNKKIDYFGNYNLAIKYSKQIKDGSFEANQNDLKKLLSIP